MADINKGAALRRAPHSGLHGKGPARQVRSGTNITGFHAVILGIGVPMMKSMAVLLT